jgi:hypothetical protein
VTDGTALRAPYPAAGAVLAGRYEVGEEIGRGAYSVVYAARDRVVDASIALKLLVPPPAVAATARERMRREVRAARSLSHPNVVRVFDFADDGGWSFIAMERVAGPDLHVRVRERGPLLPDDAVRMAMGIAAALSAAHRRGILHRDVKPQNILLDPDGRARLTDFGSARLDDAGALTQTAALVGTLAYTAPEVVAGRRGDARADVHALGITLYFALTGQLPGSPSPHLPPTPEPAGHRPRRLRPEVPAWLDDVVARCTAAAPEARFPTADALLHALEARTASAAMVPALGDGAPCPLCGADALLPGPCLSCGDAPYVRADTLVAVRMAAGAGSAVLAPFLAGGGRVRERLAGGGEVALARVPAPAAAQVARRLAAQGVPARTVPSWRAWTLIPPSFVLLTMAVGAIGMYAGLAAMRELVFTTPLFVTALLLAAYIEAGSPLVMPRKRRSPLPAAVDRTVAATLSTLPDGGARRLLADVARLGGTVYTAARERGDPFGVGPRVSGALMAACAVALDLDRLDQALAHLQAPEPRAAGGEAWLDALARCERMRDASAQRLLDALTVLGLLSAEAATAASLEPLAALTRELERDAAAQGEARREIDALLGSPRAAAGAESGYA